MWRGGWRGAAVALLVVAWEAIDATGNLKQITEWWGMAKPYWLSVWSAVTSVDGTWYRAGLFVAGILWTVYAASRPEPADASARTPMAAPLPGQASVSVAAPATRESVRRELYYLDMCWEFEPAFFENDYRSVHNPNTQTLENMINGPFCPKCVNSMRGETRESRGFLNDYRPIYAIENPCSRCGHTIEAQDATIYDYLSAVWSEAQRLVRLGQPFPAWPLRGGGNP